MRHSSLHKMILCFMLSICASSTIMASDPNDSFSPVKSPEIPSHVTFAGQRISLETPNMYERYDRELTSLAYTHGSTLLTLKRANKLFPVLAPILKANGVPEDLLYLACVESTLDPMAVSGAKAAGLWQFMPATGREFGLEVNDDVDERFNIEKSTEAACRFIKNAYKKYGNWESAMASYNGGQGRISRELEAQMVDSAFDLWLVSETSRYMFRIMAMKEILEHPAKYGYHLEPSQLYQPVKYEVAEVDSAVTSWPEWAKEQGIDYLTLRQHNPWIRSRKLPNEKGKTYKVLIPTEESRRRPIHPIVFNKNWTATRND